LDKILEAVYIYLQVKPETRNLQIQTKKRPSKLGLLLVGWGGNNGSTITAALEANRRHISWRTRNGVQAANWFGSITQSSTVLLGSDEKENDVFAPMKNLLPMVDPDDIVIGGWDISSLNIGEAMKRAQVLEPVVQDMVYEKLAKYKPMASIYDPDFIAANQSERADNCIGGTKYEQYQQIVKDIRDFKQQSGVDSVVVLWTANTERFSEIKPGLNATMSDVQKSLKNNASEISPSTIFAMASIVEGVCGKFVTHFIIC
jgi:myo-inositol-1-phosphate synthase